MSTDDEATRRRADLQEGWGAPDEQPQGGSPWSAPPQQPYAGQPPAGAYPPAGAPAAYAAPEPWGPLAGWGTRVLASLIDSLLTLIGLVPYIAGIPLLVAGLPGREYDPVTGTYQSAGDGDGALVGGGIALMVLGFVVMVAIGLWNRVFKQGRTGQSVGKKAMGIKLVEERTGQPVGAGMSFVREIVHVVDGIAYVGYLWPLWDDKKQTFADKILSTLVVRLPGR